MEHVPCNLCGKNDYNLHLKVPVNDKFIDLVKCVHCGLIYQNPRLSEEERLAFYSEAYFQKGYFDSGNQDRLYKNAILVLENLSCYCGKGKLLDVGASSGAYVKAAIDSNWEAYGVELSSAAVKFAKGHWGVDLLQGTLEENHFPDNSFDVITLMHTLEHLPSPLQTLREIKRILKRRGVLYVAVPNIASYKARRLKEKWWPLMPVEHLFFFSPGTLKHLFKEAGFYVIRSDTSIPVVSLEGLQNSGLPVNEEFRTAVNKHLPTFKNAMRHLLGKIIQGEGLELLARPKGSR